MLSSVLVFEIFAEHKKQFVSYGSTLLPIRSLINCNGIFCYHQWFALSSTSECPIEKAQVSANLKDAYLALKEVRDAYKETSEFYKRSLSMAAEFPLEGSRVCLSLLPIDDLQHHLPLDTVAGASSTLAFMGGVKSPSVKQFNPLELLTAAASRFTSPINQPNLKNFELKSSFNHLKLPKRIAGAAGTLFQSDNLTQSAAASRFDALLCSHTQHLFMCKSLEKAISAMKGKKSTYLSHFTGENSIISSVIGYSSHTDQHSECTTESSFPATVTDGEAYPAPSSESRIHSVHSFPNASIKEIDSNNFIHPLQLSDGGYRQRSVAGHYRSDFSASLSSSTTSISTGKANFSQQLLDGKIHSNGALKICPPSLVPIPDGKHSRDSSSIPACITSSYASSVTARNEFDENFISSSHVENLMTTTTSNCNNSSFCASCVKMGNNNKKLELDIEILNQNLESKDAKIAQQALEISRLSEELTTALMDETIIKKERDALKDALVHSLRAQKTPLDIPAIASLPSACQDVSEYQYIENGEEYNRPGCTCQNDANCCSCLNSSEFNDNDDLENEGSKYEPSSCLHSDEIEITGTPEDGQASMSALSKLECQNEICHEVKVECNSDFDQKMVNTQRDAECPISHQSLDQTIIKNISSTIENFSSIMSEIVSEIVLDQSHPSPHNRLSSQSLRNATFTPTHHSEDANECDILLAHSSPSVQPRVVNVKYLSSPKKNSHHPLSPPQSPIHIVDIPNDCDTENSSNISTPIFDDTPNQTNKLNDEFDIILGVVPMAIVEESTTSPCYLNEDISLIEPNEEVICIQPSTNVLSSKNDFVSVVNDESQLPVNSQHLLTEKPQGFTAGDNASALEQQMHPVVLAVIVESTSSVVTKTASDSIVSHGITDDVNSMYSSQESKRSPKDLNLVVFNDELKEQAQWKLDIDMQINLPPRPGLGHLPCEISPSLHLQTQSEDDSSDSSSSSSSSSKNTKKNIIENSATIQTNLPNEDLKTTCLKNLSTVVVGNSSQSICAFDELQNRKLNVSNNLNNGGERMFDNKNELPETEELDNLKKKYINMKHALASSQRHIHMLEKRLEEANGRNESRQELFLAMSRYHHINPKPSRPSSTASNNDALSNFKNASNSPKMTKKSPFSSAINKNIAVAAIPLNQTSVIFNPRNNNYSTIEKTASVIATHRTVSEEQNAITAPSNIVNSKHKESKTVHHKHNDDASPLTTGNHITCSPEDTSYGQKSPPLSTRALSTAKTIISSQKNKLPSSIPLPIDSNKTITTNIIKPRNSSTSIKEEAQLLQKHRSPPSRRSSESHHNNSSPKSLPRRKKSPRIPVSAPAASTVIHKRPISSPSMAIFKRSASPQKTTVASLPNAPPSASLVRITTASSSLDNVLLAADSSISSCANSRTFHLGPKLSVSLPPPSPSDPPLPTPVSTLTTPSHSTAALLPPRPISVPLPPRTAFAASVRTPLPVSPTNTHIVPPRCLRAPPVPHSARLKPHQSQIPASNNFIQSLGENLFSGNV